MILTVADIESAKQYQYITTQQWNTARVVNINKDV